MSELYYKIIEYASLLNMLHSSPEKGMLQKAENVRTALAQYVIDKNGVDGVYWWNIPVLDVLETMEENTLGDYDQGGWRISSGYKYSFNNNSIELYIEEEGHYSNFSSSKNVSFSTVSRYSEAEREAMVSDYNKRIDSQEQWNIATTEGRVYSEQYDKVYDSAWDYYHSAEHQIDRQIDSDFYAQTLVRNKQTTVTTVYSNSLHYKSLFSIAEFMVDNSGNLLMLGYHGAQKIAAHGSGESYAGQDLVNKDSRILLADYLMSDSRVKRIGIDLLDRTLYAECSNYTEALYNAAMIGKLGGKLCYTEFEGSAPCFTDEQAAHCNALIKKVTSGEALDESETTDLLHAVINGGINMGYLNIVWLKVSLIYDLAILNVNDVSRCFFYSKLCISLIQKTFSQFADKNAIRQFAMIAVLTSGVCAEERFDRKLYEESFQYADVLEEYLEKLEEVDPYNEVFRNLRMYKKLLKKISKCRAKMKK